MYHFNVNNRDNALKEHRYSDHRLVFRRNGQALKLFDVFSSVDGKQVPIKLGIGWGTMHDYYHPLPNQEGQGKDGSVNQYYWVDGEGKEHIRINTYVMDSSEEIVHWHVYLMEDGFVRMENPAADAWIDVKADMGRVMIRNEKEKEEILWFDE